MINFNLSNKIKYFELFKKYYERDIKLFIIVILKYTNFTNSCQ